MTLTLTPVGDATLLTLTHIRFASAVARDRHLGGWTVILAARISTEL